MTIRRRNYVDVLVERELLRKDSVVVEGCVGNIGVESSLIVAQALGRGGEFYMVERDPTQLHIHRVRFGFEGIETVSPGVRLEWIEGAIEDKSALISRSDALLFHNYTPVDLETYNGRQEGAHERFKRLFKKLIDAKPKVIAFYLPYFKDPDGLSRFMESLGVQCELVDRVAYAGKLEPHEEEEWMGKAVIGIIRE